MDHLNDDNTMKRKLEIKASKNVDITIPPIDYEKGRRKYKIALPTNLKPFSQSNTDSSYQWKESEAKSIRNSDMLHIMDGTMKILSTSKTLSHRQTPVVDIVLPKIIHGRGKTALEKIRKESDLKKLMERDGSGENVYGPRERELLANAVPPNSLQSVFSGIKKRHRHKHRNESKMCRHHEKKEKVEETSEDTQNQTEENLNTLWSYTTMNANNIPDFEDDTILMMDRSDSIPIEIPEEMVDTAPPLPETFPDQTNETVNQGNVVIEAVNVISGISNLSDSKENLTSEVKKAESEWDISPLAIKANNPDDAKMNQIIEAKKDVLPPIAKLGSDPCFSEQLSFIQAPNTASAARTPQKMIQQKDIKSMLPKDIRLAMFRWKYAIESIFRQFRIKKLPNIQIRHFDYSQILPEDEMNKYKRSQIDRLEKSLEIIKKVPDLKQKHLDLAILKFEETFRKAFPWFQTLKGAVRNHIAHYARLEYHPRGRAILKEGGTTRTIYMLAFGLCVEHQQFKDTDGQKRDQAIGLVRSGTSIGETLGNAIPRRISSVTTLTRSLFVCIEKNEWMKAMKKGDDEASKIEGIAGLPLFQKLPLKQIQALSAVCTETSATTEATVLEPFHEAINLYFIKKGKCSLTLHVPFVKTVKDTVQHLISPSEYQVVPFHGQVLKPGKDELVHTTFPMAELGPGDCFPPVYIRDIRGTYKSYTVTSMEATDFLIFNMTTVHTMFPAEVVAGIRAQQDETYYNDSQAREVQEHYLSTKGWRNDNDSIIAQLLSREIDTERGERVANRFNRKRIVESDTGVDE